MQDLPSGCKPAIGSDGKPISGFAVRDDGVVFYWREQWKRWIPLKVKIGPPGFRRVNLAPRRQYREIGVALLVPRAFVGPRPIGCEPLHYPDPDPGNNRLDNLRWAPRGTSKLGRQLGPTPPSPGRGESHHLAILTEDLVRDIRTMYREGFRYKEIAADLGASEEAVRHVLIGKTWTHVPDPEGPIVMRHKGPDSESANLSKLDWETVATIRRLHTEGKTYRQISEQLSVNQCTVRDVCVYRTWKNPP